MQPAVLLMMRYWPPPRFAGAWFQKPFDRLFVTRFGILVEFGVLEVSTFPSAKYHPYTYMSAD